jgi:hypothetical protein
MQRVHSPELGTTLRERLDVWDTSLALGRCRFTFAPSYRL